MNNLSATTSRRLEEFERALILSGVLDVESHLRVVLGEPDQRPLPLTSENEIDLSRLFAEDGEVNQRGARDSDKTL